MKQSKLFRNHEKQKWHIEDPRDQPSLCGMVSFISWLSDRPSNSSNNNICKSCRKINGLKRVNET